MGTHGYEGHPIAPGRPLVEDDIIARHFAPMAGPGGLGLRDDAALATPAPGHDLVVTKDMLVAGVHFFVDDPPDAIARKALRVNLSDLAAKGATPIGFLLGLGLPAETTDAWLACFAAGLADDSRHFACPLLGGDTVRTPGPLTLSITAFGEVAASRMVPRTGARAGDVIYVTGTIGDAAIGLRERRADAVDADWIARLDPAAAAEVRDRYLLPRPRLRLRTALVQHARAAMDVSDGLVGDLGKMLGLATLTTTLSANDVPLSSAARAAIALAPRLLETALTGGDDYEVLCAVAPDQAEAFERGASDAGIAVSRLGCTATGAQPPIVLDARGVAFAFGPLRFSHF